MVVLRFEAKLTKGNAEGIGFLRIPISQRKKVKRNDNVRVTVKNGKTVHIFYRRLKDYGGLGIYVSKDIASKFSAYASLVVIEKIDGFHTKIRSGGQIYIPQSISKKFLLQNGNIIRINFRNDRIEKERFCLVKCRKSAENECLVAFHPPFTGESGICRIVKKVERKAHRKEFLPRLDRLAYGLIDNEHVVLFHGQKVPIVTTNTIDLGDIAHYLGYFFADGTKRGNSWGLCISTFEQAREFFNVHKKLIPDTKTEKYLSFTGPSFDEKRKNSLIEKWKKETGIVVERVVSRESKIFDAPNRNRFGTLVLREHRKLTQIYYNNLVENLCQRIEKEKNEKFGIDFICGVLEGDGSPSSRRDGNIIISTNKTEAKILERVLSVIGLQYNIVRDKKRNKISIRLGSLSVLRNIPLLKDKLFKYYPKRRKKFIHRFQNVGAVKFILGRQKHSPPWVRAYLRENNIVNSDNLLTPYGKRIKRCLEGMIEENQEEAIV